MIYLTYKGEVCKWPATYNPFYSDSLEKVLDLYIHLQTLYPDADFQLERK